MDALTGIWGPTMMIFGAVALATIATALVIEWALGMRQRRVVVRQLDALSASTSSVSAALLRDVDPAAAGRWIEAMALRVPHVRGLASLLDRAGVSWTPQSFLVTTLGLAGLPSTTA